MTSDAVHLPAVSPPGTAEVDGGRPTVVVARTGGGWCVFSPGRAEDVGDLLEGMSVADLVAEELGVPAQPDRTARRAARGAGDEEPPGDPRDARIAALERTVAQLEHALASRVVVERAIGVLAERHSVAPRAAFETLRAQARSFGRPVHDLAREVLATLERLPGEPRPDRAGTPTADAGGALPPAPRRGAGRRVERSASRPSPAAPADGRR
ncbi:ANTAR domain-containing protein [Geodermatophilus telluris]|uniref:ANTAR domain-containing protein n=1 Tax=Geodermatophilus telluris TaxID=1190417 RepID=A0A1G6IDX2_9ACTN|nr:ANTAR domain-containing protein [Geodermatophilus telluris]SDC03936.1 ANTAR domain-containing protein [Geodermatophilus telluris]